MSKRVLIFLMVITTTGIKMLRAQDKNPIVQKTIEKTVTVAPSDHFSIIAEKTSLTVKGWNKNYIQLKITFSAEHTDRKIATKELEYMHYSLSREKQTIDLRNAFILPSRTDAVKSKVRVIMEINIPAGLGLSVNNRYGDSKLSDLTGKISAILQFNDLLLNNVSGEIKIQSSYSEVRGERLTVSSFISSDEESKYTLEIDRGAYSFNSKHSDHDLTVGGIKSLTIRAKHTDVTIQPKEFASFNYELLSKEGKIYLPVAFSHLLEKADNQSQLTLNQRPAMPLIDVTTTFNTITIQ